MDPVAAFGQRCGARTMTGHLVSATDLVLKYGQHQALSASTFHIPPVQTTAIIGPNGSGKSTILSAIAGLVPVAGGSLRILGAEPLAARSRISYVLQSTPVPASTPITVHEAVAMGRYPAVGLWRRFRPADREAIAAAMDRMDIADLAGRHLHELSGGQRQRVSVAQAIAQRHDVLLLDEPLTGLDLRSARTIDDLIHGRRNDAEHVVVTTHDLDEARAADWVVLVNRTVLAYGPPSEVCTRPNLEVAFGLGALHEWEGFLDYPDHNDVH
jgi:iron complex transport system ATP-binding protein